MAAMKEEEEERVKAARTQKAPKVLTHLSRLRLRCSSCLSGRQPFQHQLTLEYNETCFLPNFHHFHIWHLLAKVAIPVILMVSAMRAQREAFSPLISDVADRPRNGPSDRVITKSLPSLRVSCMTEDGIREEVGEKMMRRGRLVITRGSPTKPHKGGGA